MNVFQLKTLFHVFMVTAFLSMQCSGAHIHLAKNHDHGASSHHHASQVHAHQVSDHRKDSIYTPASTINSQIIEISQESVSQGWNKLDDMAGAIIPANFVFLSSKQQHHPIQLSAISSRLPWLSYATTRSRAPPTIAS